MTLERFVMFLAAVLVIVCALVYLSNHLNLN